MPWQRFARRRSGCSPKRAHRSSCNSDHGKFDIKKIQVLILCANNYGNTCNGSILNLTITKVQFGYHALGEGEGWVLGESLSYEVVKKSRSTPS